MNICQTEYVARIFSAIDEFFTYEEDLTLENLEDFVATEIPELNQEFSLQSYVANEDGFKQSFLNILKVNQLDPSDYIQNLSSSEVTTKSNITPNLSSSQISGLFHTLPLAKAKFDSEATAAILKGMLIGGPSDTNYVSTSDEVTKNFTILKNDLFKKIQEFLLSKSLLKGKINNLYNDNGDLIDYNHYKQVMNTIDDYFFNEETYDLIETYSNKVGIPNLAMSTITEADVFEAYNAAILLANFDTVLAEYFSGILDVNYNLFNNLRTNLGGNNKYSIKIKGIETPYWKTDSHEAEGSETNESKLIKLLVSTIPIYNKKGENSGRFMELNDLYLLAAQITEFEILHGNKFKNLPNSTFKYFNEAPREVLLKYLSEIKTATSTTEGYEEYRNHFESIFDITNSLKQFIESPDHNIEEKEKNSTTSIIEMFAQVINNNFGASYFSYDSKGKYRVREMYKQNFSNTQVQDTLFSHLVRTNNTKLDITSVSDSDETKNTNKNLVKDELDKLFEGLTGDLKDLPKDKKIAFNQFMGARTGVHISYLGFDDFVEDLKRSGKETSGNLGLIAFRNLLDGFTQAVSVSYNAVKTGIKEKKIEDTGQGDIVMTDYTKATIGDPIFQALRNAFLINYPVKAVMTIETLKKAKLPTFKLANLTNKDTELFQLQREFEKKWAGKRVFKSLLLADTPVILGTGTKLELINDETSKEAAKFNVAESFTADFQYDFLQNIIDAESLESSKISITLGNYSDKNTILTKIINGGFKYNIGGEEKNVLQLSDEELLGLIQQQGGNFYKDAITKVLEDYNKLLFLSPILNNIGTLDIEATIATINNILKTVDVRSLSERASDLKINFTEELHYSKYNKEVYLNQLLVDNYRIFNNKEIFAEFVTRQENSMLEKFSKYTKNDEIVFSHSGMDMEKILSRLNIKETAFDLKDPKDPESRHYTKLVGKSGLNPLLKKWMWINALYRNEYQFISSKGEYMHPYKLKTPLNYRGNSNDLLSEDSNIRDTYWSNYQTEVTGRLITMAKRNVLNTATIEVPVRHSKLGVPENVNMATIEDFRSPIYNIAGDRKNLEVHDGSTYMTAVYSMMLDNSFPAKGYSGTKKQFGTLITEQGVTIKKDAESVITNDKILNSKKSTIPFYAKQKQMLGIKAELNGYKFKEDFNNEFFFNKVGERYRIDQLFIKGNYAELTVSKLVDGEWVLEKDNIKKTFSTLFELWDLFGAQFSTDENGDFNEGSNDLLFKVVTQPNIYGEYRLKDAMIHIVSNLSAVKAGGVNVNHSDYWFSENNLAYYTFANRFMGPQLDPSHDLDGSKIKEITQVISALAQNVETAHLAQEAYNDIAKVIEQAIKPYLKYMGVGENVKKTELYKYLSDKFVKTIENSKGDNIAKILVQSFDKDTVIPFSNQNFFVPFVRDVITRMNNEFITRYYSGTGAVLIPSHGIIQVYSIPQSDGSYKTITQSDLAKEALNWYSVSNEKTLTSNDDIINAYLNNILPSETINWDKIKLGDTIERPEEELSQLLEIELDYISNLEFQTEESVKNYMEKSYQTLKNVTLFSPDLYYKYKGTRTTEKVVKVNNVPRDLKPSEITFTVNGIQRNLFDLDSVRLRFKLDKFSKDNFSTLLESDSDYEILQKFYAHFTKRSLLKDFATDKAKVVTFLTNKLNKWTQRNLEFLNEEVVLANVNEATDFKNFFGKDNLELIFSDAKSLYKPENLVKIFDYKFFAAELILGDLYGKNFGRTNESMAQIKSEGSNFFQKQLESSFENDDTKADVKLILSNIDHPIYIKFTDKLPGNDYKFPLVLERSLDDESADRKFVRRNQLGEIVYTLPDHTKMRVRNEDGKEVIYIKAAASFSTRERTRYAKSESFNDDLRKLIKSFGSNIKTLVPLMNNNFADKELSMNLNGASFYLFKDFSGYISSNKKNLNAKWYQTNRQDIITQLSNKMYASWEKSHEFIAARIPAQSMQSFMEMKNVAYMKGNTNDAYVSVWQIWLQGSDFDIDKAYMLGSGFNANGQFESWSNLSNYSTIEQLHAIEKLPLPTGKSIGKVITGEGLDLSLEAAEFFKIDLSFSDLLKTGNFLEALKDVADVNKFTVELSVAQINIINGVLRKLNTYQTETSNPSSIITGLDKELHELFVTILNKHNADNEYLYKNHAVKNSVVSRIKQVISSPVNQLLANIPVDVNIWQEAADAAVAAKGQPLELLSSYDIFSFYKQQRDAAVGKDDVGIAANGLKVLYALTSYYNNYYINNFNQDKKIIRNSSKTFKKTFIFKDIDPAKNKSYTIGAVSDVALSQSQKKAITDVVGEFDNFRAQAAIALSSFTSAATDNAKELLMAKINASVELASMHIYLLTLGFTAVQVSEIMTMPIIDEVIDALEVNTFLSSKKVYVPLVFESLNTKYNKDPIMLQNIKTLSDIYSGAQEIKVLAKILGVNQKTTANIEEVNNFLTTFETAIYGRENQIFQKNLKDFGEWKAYKDSVDFTKAAEVEGKFSKLVDLIFENNPVLNPKTDRDEVSDFLKNASSIKVAYLDQDGVRQTKFASVIGGQFDFRYYVNADKQNDAYRAATIRYYNYIKNTFNIFDIIDTVPHFKQMVRGITVAHDLLQNTSIKYNSVFSLVKDVVREDAERIVFYDGETNSHIRNNMGNKAIAPRLGTSEVGKILTGIDIVLKKEWLKSPNTSMLTFNVTKLLQKLNALNEENGKPIVKDFRIYTTDEAWNTDAIESNSKLVNESDEEETIVTLDTNFGIANFKRVMEEILLPLLQMNSNVLTDSLRVQQVRNVLGLRTSGITSASPLSNLSNPVSKQKAQELIKAFNDLDVSTNSSWRVTNASDQALRWKDLFYVYNLLLNNEKYGNLRLTPLFEDYIKEKHSLGYDYVTFSSLIDTGELKLFDLDRKLANDIEYVDAENSKDVPKMRQIKERVERQLRNDILFYTYGRGGKLVIKGLNKKANHVLKITNGDFLVVDSVTESEEIRKSQVEINELLRILRTRGFIIKFKC